MVMLTQPEIDALLPAWATTYLACAGNQAKTRETLVKEGQPWSTLLYGERRTQWAAKAQKLTHRCRQQGLLPKVVTKKEQRRIQLESDALKTLDQIGAVNQVKSAILPGILKRIATAEEVMENLTEIALGRAPEYDSQDPPTSAQRLKLRLDALTTLSNILALDRRPPTMSQTADRFRRLREKLAALPLEQRRALLTVLGDPDNSEQRQEVTP